MIADLLHRKRNAELALFAAAIAWRNARGTVAERDAAKYLAAMTGELLDAAEDLDEAVTEKLHELQGTRQ